MKLKGARFHRAPFFVYPNARSGRNAPQILFEAIEGLLHFFLRTGNRIRSKLTQTITPAVSFICLSSPAKASWAADCEPWSV
jgi:hypothetical protein